MIFSVKNNSIKNSYVFKAVEKIFGISKTKSLILCKQIGVSNNLKVYELKQNQLIELSKIVNESNLIFGNNLKQLNRFFLDRLVLLKNYRGIRLIKGFPVRGQRTHTNAKTSKKFALKNKKK